MAESRPLEDAEAPQDGTPGNGAEAAAVPEVVRMESCTGFLVSADGQRFRLQLQDSGDRSCLVELPVSALTALIKALPEIQQTALPRTGSGHSMRIVRQAASWSLERDMADDALTLVLLTAEGFEWCFTLADSDVFRMAECLREERTVTLPAHPQRQ